MIDPIQVLPAPGQGALAVECRSDRDDVVAAVSVLDDPDTRACVVAERSLLAALEAGCTAPVGALAEVVEGDDGLELSLRAFAGTEDGSVELRRSLVGPYDEPEALGSRLARILLEDGAADLQVATTSAGPAPDHRPTPTGASFVTPSRQPSEQTDPTPTHATTPARVAFVGSGPGDPGLMTLRGRDLLAAADVVVLDRIARDDVVLEHARPDVEIIDAGHGEHGQELTHAVRAKLVVKAAKSVAPRRSRRAPHGRRPRDLQRPRRGGARVPQGRHHLRRRAGRLRRSPPGPTYAGVPLTSKSTGAVHVVGVDRTGVDWSAYAADTDTLVLLGGTDGIRSALAALRAAGRPADSLVALTAHGTTVRQSSVATTLGEADAVFAGKEPLEVSLAVVSPNVALRDEFVVVRDQAALRLEGARAAHQGAGRLDGRAPRRLRRDAPTSCRRSRSSRRARRSRWRRPSRAWSPAATSGSASRRSTRCAPCASASRSSASTPAPSPVSRSPPSVASTAAALREWGINPDLVPAGEQSAAGLLESWPEFDEVLDPINRVLLPRADIATETLVAGLRDMGWEVDDVTAYRTVRAAPPAASIRDAIKGGDFDAVLFTSSSTVRNLVGIAGKPHAATVVAVHRPGHGEDGAGARPAGRRPRAGGRRPSASSTRSPVTASASPSPRPRRASRCSAQRQAPGSRRRAR